MFPAESTSIKSLTCYSAFSAASLTLSLDWLDVKVVRRSSLTRIEGVFILSLELTGFSTMLAMYGKPHSGDRIGIRRIGRKVNEYWHDRRRRQDETEVNRKGQDER